MRSESERRKDEMASDRRSIKPKVTNKSETSSPTQGCPSRQELNHPQDNATNASPDSATLPIPKQNNILCVLLLIGHVFDLFLCESDFGNEIIDLNSEFELEKSGLTNCVCDVLPSPTNNTISVSHTHHHLIFVQQLLE